MNEFAKPIQMITDEHGFVVGRKYVDELTPNPMTKPTNNPFDDQVEQEAIAYAHGYCGNPINSSILSFIAGANSKAVTDKIADLEKQIPKWVSMEERLPEIGECYLTFPLNMSLPFGNKDDWEKQDDETDSCFWQFSEMWEKPVKAHPYPTHWMPLPPKPPTP
jgi:hypothetical protein